jgi:hypothetical protein
MHKGIAIVALMLLTGAAPPAFSVQDITYPENIGLGFIVVQKNAPAADPSTVNVQTLDGTGKAGVDYQGVNVNVTFAPGELEKRVPVKIINNPGVTGERTFWAKVTPVSNAVLNRDYASVMIADMNQTTPTLAWVPATPAVGGYVRLVAPDKGWDNYQFTYDNVVPPTYVGQVYKVINAGYTGSNVRQWEVLSLKKNRFGTNDVFFFADSNVQGVAPAPGYSAPN